MRNLILITSITSHTRLWKDSVSSASRSKYWRTLFSLSTDSISNGSGSKFWSIFILNFFSQMISKSAANEPVSCDKRGGKSRFFIHELYETKTKMCVSWTSDFSEKSFLELSSFRLASFLIVDNWILWNFDLPMGHGKCWHAQRTRQNYLIKERASSISESRFPQTRL